MGVIKIAGKNPSEQAAAVAVDANGSLITVKKWQNEVVEVMNEDIRDTNTHTSTNLDLSDAVAVSLRVHNTTGQGFTLGLYNDITPNNNYWVSDADGSYFTMSVSGSSNRVAITPDDMPILQWLTNLKFRVVFDEAPASGTLVINAIVKR